MIPDRNKISLHTFIAYFLFAIAILTPLCAEARQRQIPVNPKPICYKLINLGATTLDQELLSRSSWPLTLAPRINKKGDVILNHKDNGFIWNCQSGFSTYCYEGIPAHFVDINDTGGALGFADFPDGGREWFIWSECCGLRERLPTFVNTACIRARDICFRSISNQAVLVGARETYNGFISIFWDSRQGIKDLNYGKLWDINNRDYMLGSEDFRPGQEPYLWHIRGGAVILSDGVKCARPTKFAYFIDYAIAPDNVVYGTYRDPAGGHGDLLAFYWDPCDQVFHPLDLNQMRISAVNRCHTLVGSLCGIAAISFNHDKPMPLASLVQGNMADWKLIEATDINDIGQIVGYGTYRGVLHQFMLHPLY